MRHRFLAPTLVGLAAMTALVGAPATAAPGGSAPPALSWHDCHTAQTPKQLQCATLAVPLDWSHPRRGSITLSLNRLPATDPAHRIGPLLLNPGGPGGSGTEVVAYGGMLLGTPALQPLRQRFDLIGFDPRGVGGSQPVRCDAPVYDPGSPAFPSTSAQYQAMLDSAHRHGSDCAHRTGAEIGHVDTVSAARDMDAIRQALGDRTISYLGVSYGTELGETYARLFPGHLHRTVLDGAIDHSRPMATDAVDEAAAIQAEFSRFTAWCGATASCALHGQDIPAGLAALIARADRGEITDPTLKRRLTSTEITAGVYDHLYMTAMWPDLATSLASAAATPSDPSKLTEAIPAKDPTYPSYRAISCHDFAPKVTGLGDLAAREKAVRRAAPDMWRYSEFWDMTTGCAGWPVRPANPPHRERVTGAPPVLVVGNTHDPATPYPWARALSGQIAGSRLFTVDGDGHTALYNSACGRAAEVAYLTGGTLPAPGATCRD